MALVSASACGKLILLGEHAVVYGYPAIAMPFTALRLRAFVEPAIIGPKGLRIMAPELCIETATPINELPPQHPLRASVNLVLEELGLTNPPSCTLRIKSDMPFYSGLGSSAALAVATVKAVSAFVGAQLNLAKVNALAYEVEKLNHGNPSGIDNTVISYERPIYFIKGTPPEILKPRSRFNFLVADSGVSKSTAETVAELRTLYEKDKERITKAFERIAEVVEEGKHALLTGDASALGLALTANQNVLTGLDLSCPKLDTIIATAMAAGALGAKLSGGGRGGHAIVLVNEGDSQKVREALLVAGAKTVHSTVLEGSHDA